MLANNPVLPNFIKALTVAAFALASTSALATGHGDHKADGHGDHKKVEEMKADVSTEVEGAIPELSDLNKAAEDVVPEEMPAESVEGGIEDLKAKASSLAEE